MPRQHVVTLWTVTPMDDGGERHTPLAQISRTIAKQIIADAKKHHYDVKAENNYWSGKLERVTVTYHAVPP